ncbi:hypothetical protein ACFX2H_024470 [Malus domestica]
MGVLQSQIQLLIEVLYELYNILLSHGQTLVFFVNQVCQFMHCPMETHFVAVKRILRYLKGSLTLGLCFRHGPVHLRAYIDVDWAGDPNDRRSTTGFVVSLGSNPIS